VPAGFRASANNSWYVLKLKYRRR